MKTTTNLRQLNCAIYTRKSTEEGLEQEFNTLDAQRESAECYIKSQEAEGWVCLPEHYDDGGYTGGNMERPALKRLLADIEAGKVDCVVVYKVDRLSRSLMDFAKMLEVFERKRVAFVSVTQQFNTTNSMGRLMLNVLLSFAQFEREIISERTRDKMAAARRKGKWVGGLAPLGYDIDPVARRLKVNEDEASRVRAIFELYLEVGSIISTLKEIDRRDWRNKRSITRKGKERGGRHFDKSSLFKLLTNMAYIGKVRYKEEVHNGEHEPIVPVGHIFFRLVNHIDVRFLEGCDCRLRENDSLRRLLHMISDHGPSFALANQDFAFAKFAAIELGKALKASPRLQSNTSHSIETEFIPKESSASKWIEDYYAVLDASGATYDPVSQTFTPFPPRHPVLRLLDPWQEVLESAVVRFLQQYRKANSDAITEGFSSYEEYARQYVHELTEFGTVKRCWSVDLDGSHHNQAFLEYDDWFAMIRLSGVPRGLLESNTTE